MFTARWMMDAAPCPLFLGVCAKKITELLKIPVIGIGAGPDTNAQIMVLHDVLGVSPITPKFVKNFLIEGNNSIFKTIEAYVNAVKSKSFPSEEHCFN